MSARARNTPAVKNSAPVAVSVRNAQKLFGQFLLPRLAVPNWRPAVSDWYPSGLRISPPVRVITDPVRVITGPVRDIMGPVRVITVPVGLITGPVRIITGSVRVIMGLVRVITGCQSYHVPTVCLTSKPCICPTFQNSFFFSYFPHLK